MEFPTVADIVEMHRKLLERTGGTPGLMNVGSIESALHRCQWGFFQQAPDLLDRAAFLLRGLCQDHPFADGNKRTAFAVAEVFLRENGVLLDAAGDEVIAFMLSVAQGKENPITIAEWLRFHSQNG